MSKELFEEELRRKLKGYQPEVDTQLLWNNIQQQQPKSYLGWVAMFMVAMSLGVGLAFWNISENEQNLQSENQNQINDVENLYTLDQNNDKQNSSKQVISTENNSEIATTENTLVEKTITEPKDAIVEIDKPEAKINSVKYFAGKNEESTSVVSNSNVVENNDYTVVENIEETAFQLENTIVNDFVELAADEQEALNEASFVVDNNIEANSKDENQSIDNEEEFNPVNNVGEITSEIGENSAFESINIIQEEVAQEEVATNTFLDVAPISNEKIEEVKVKRDDIGKDKKRKPKNSGQRIKIKNSPSTFELTTEASVGPLFPIKKLEATGDEYNTYLEARNATETVLRGFKAEVNTIGGFKKHGYFKVGINYAGFTEAFNYTDIKTHQFWDPNGISSYEIGPSGDTTYIYDSVLVTQVVQRKISARNSYQMLDLTTALGVTYSHSKWAIFVDAGLAYNILFKSKGRFLDKSLQPIAFNEPLSDAGHAYRRNLGVAVVANVGFAYEIKPNFSFKIQSGYKRYINNFSTASNPIKQKYNFIDFGMGFQYTFNNF